MPLAPTEELVRSACKTFDEAYAVTENALQDLFCQYRDNRNHAHVLLKVVTLNRLYSTHILAVHEVARQIHEHATRIDTALGIGAQTLSMKSLK